MIQFHFWNLTPTVYYWELKLKFTSFSECASTESRANIYTHKWTFKTKQLRTHLFFRIEFCWCFTLIRLDVCQYQTAWACKNTRNMKMTWMITSGFLYLYHLWRSFFLLHICINTCTHDISLYIELHQNETDSFFVNFQSEFLSWSAFFGFCF